MLIYLVYVSSAVQLMSDQELVELLRQSRENNSQLDISGLLLYRQGNFMQILEGPEENVLRVHQKILADPRHKNVITLLQGPQANRQFDHWAMAFQNIDKLSKADLAAYSSFLDSNFTAEEFGQNPHKALKLLLTFKQNMR